MRPRFVLAGLAAVLLVGGGVTGAILLGNHHAPPSLALSTPTATNAEGSLAGRWNVAPGSEAGYRVRERFINQATSTEAVARTTKVSGGLKVVLGSGSSVTASAIHFTVDLSALTSQDSYAKFQTYERDFFIRSIYLQTDLYPNADFTATSVSVPGGVTAAPITLDVAGSLKVHGVTKAVTSQLHVQLNGARIEVAGAINVDMRDFNVEVPSISFTKAEPLVVIEYQVMLVRA